MKLDLSSLAQIVGGILSAGSDPSATVDTALVAFDSREIKAEGLFFALISEKQDGAKYIAAAFEKGARASIAQTNPDNLPNVILVPDSLQAFRDLGKHVRAQYKGLVIGVTGSSGKTTAKELLAHMLSRFDKTFCGEGSLNNHIGVPYNLCRLDLDAAYAVFEIGMDHAGEISMLVALTQPHVVAVTNVFPMHMEYFKEFRDIAFAKAEIFETVLPYNGRTLALINADTSFADEVLIPEAKKHGIRDIVTYGKRGEVTLQSFSINANCKTDVAIGIEGKTYRHADLGLGERFAYNATFALALAYALALDLDKALLTIADFAPLKGRGKISTPTVPGKDYTITLIDDSYNGQPAAMLYAIGTLGDIPKDGARKVAIIGKMSEIGAAAEEEHRAVGKALAASDVDVVIGVGAETRFVLDEVPDTKIKIFKDSVDGLFDLLTGTILQPKDIVLIKGAHYASRVFEIADKLLRA